MRQSVCAEIRLGPSHVRAYGVPAAQMRTLPQIVHDAVRPGKTFAQSRAGFRRRCRDGAATTRHYANWNAANLAIPSAAVGAVAASMK